MKTAELKVELRSSGNRSENRQLRTKGMVPANLYGPGVKNLFCSFDERDLGKAFRDSQPGNTMLLLNSTDSNLNGKRVIMKELARDPATWRPVHADFYLIDMNRPLIVSVPIDFQGTPEGVKIGGGILQVVRRSIELKALPDKIPGSIIVDISEMKLNESTHISDLTPPEGVEFMDDASFTLASVIEQEKEEVATAAAATAEGTPAAGAEGAAAPATAEKADKKD